LPFVHRHWTKRLGAVLFGLWFCLAGFDGAADTCPMQGMAQASHAAMPAGAAHSMPMGTDSDHGSDSGHDHAHRCPCCSCCSVSVLGVPPQQNYVATADAPPMAPVASHIDAPDVWVDFVLPFSTAPPAGQLA
jgi:hypothetical protein